ncbi:invertase [Skermanella aerolata]|uniref:Invertase n=1 Tax=Skermanella aerolata TaxID=393310 RepID=A0A512E2X1_9PROT|nr:recombinase family protein [Skermanella aerolata]GEO43055.1 invertase [Skermanella aerolata]
MLVGYGRVSTQDQNPAMQEDDLRAAGCEKLFIETISSGKKDRPKLQAALEYLRSGDTLVVWRLDRLARSLDQLIATVKDLEARDIALKSLTEAIDTSTAGGKLIFHIFGSIAEFERSLIRERTKAGIAAAKARGRSGGRPPKLQGERAEHAQLMLNAGKSVSEVARSFNVSRSTVLRATRLLEKETA